VAGQTLVLIACTKSKASAAVAARDLYRPSKLFRACYQQAESDGHRIAILSALHGILLPEQVVAPYNKTVREMNTAERAAWADKVAAQFDQLFGRSEIAEVMFLAGSDYRQPVVPLLQNRGVRCRVHPEWNAICAQVFG